MYLFSFTITLGFVTIVRVKAGSKRMAEVRWQAHVQEGVQDQAQIEVIVAQAHFPRSRA